MAIERISLSTGVTLNVETAGSPDAAAIIFLHGFPESHRTWRHQIAAFADDHFVIAPDQRGFGASDQPEGLAHYATDKVVNDLFALADHFGVDRFTLVGHDWGGAIAWLAALQRPQRVERLIIINAPHPLVFQKSLIEDAEQRAASQYIRMFRTPGIEAQIDAMGLETFFDTTFARHADVSQLADERSRYLADWSRPGALTAMLNWYRGSNVVVPAIDEDAAMPAFVNAPFPQIEPPTLVIWGMRDKALLPCQFEGLAGHVRDLTVHRIDEAGHFAPWEVPDKVNEAIRAWLPDAQP